MRARQACRGAVQADFSHLEVLEAVLEDASEAGALWRREDANANVGLVHWGWWWRLLEAVVVQAGGDGAAAAVAAEVMWSQTATATAGWQAGKHRLLLWLPCARGNGAAAAAAAAEVAQQQRPTRGDSNYKVSDTVA